jgi:hypothetical protein
MRGTRLPTLEDHIWRGSRGSFPTSRPTTLGLCTCTIPFPSIDVRRFDIVSVYSLLDARSRSCIQGANREANHVTDAGDAAE